MASGITNRGKFFLLNQTFRNVTEPTTFYIHLANSTPTVDTNTMADLTEASNYTAVSVARDATDFDVMTEDDTGDQAYIQMKDIVLTAGGGTCTATYAVLTDDNATTGSREVLAFFDLGGSQAVSSGQTITLTNMQLTLS